MSSLIAMPLRAGGPSVLRLAAASTSRRVTAAGLYPLMTASLHTGAVARNAPAPTPSPKTAAAAAADTTTRALSQEGPRSEGAHYNDKTEADISALIDVDKPGGWTLMNPIYTESDLDSVKVVYRKPENIADRAIRGSVLLTRWAFDKFTGYKGTHITPEHLKTKTIEQLRETGDLLSDKAWLKRIIFLESIAGVPGMVGGTLRHLRSLRLLRRDGGWIHTLLEEAENERMHLLTFMTVARPSWMTRALVLAGQGVFYNLFFLTYLITPKTAHRFVAALEEEAVRTYTHCIEDIENGLVPEWNDKPAPQIAIDYWRMPEDASLLDVIKAVRADEATHRFVNHSLANLDQKHDFNPFALGEPAPEIRGSIPGFTREESAKYANETQQKLLGAAKEQEKQS
ncbi:inducible alternative oxidase 2 [Vanrija albida]|uniref:Alternative oxidase n=1 Tax=Vanrija albida TaxID=181172 RepID=A0ABR3PT09_9TREE